MTTEERILESALKVFSRMGYKNSSIKEIARKAEVNSLTIFRYFHDKETLFFSAINKVKESRFDSDALNSRLTYTDVAADIMIMSEAYLDEVYANISLMRVFISEAMNFEKLRKEAWFISPVLKEHFKAYMMKLDNLTPLAAKNSDLLADMLVSYITKKAMPLNKYGNTESRTPEIEEIFREAMPSQAKCMAFMLTGNT